VPLRALRYVAAVFATSSLLLLTSGPVAASGDRATVLPGSALRHVGRSRLVGDVGADKPLEVVVTLQARNPELLASLAEHSSASKPLDSARVRDLFMPSKRDVAAVRSYLGGNGFRFRAVKGLSLFFEGHAAAAEQAFGVDLALYRDAHGRSFRAASGPVRLPAALVDKVAAVDGLDDLARYRPAQSVATHAITPTAGCGAAAFQSDNGGYLPADLAAAGAYNYESLLDATYDGTGESIAFIEFSDYRHADVDKFKQCFDLNTPVTQVPVSYGTGDHSGGAEVILDVDIALAGAPGLDNAWVYIAPNTTSMAVMINQIVDEHISNGVHIISNSWGLCEAFVSASELSATNTALQLAAVQGISFFTASGDNGSSDCLPDVHGLTVDDPASQPYATAVGGTNLDLSSVRSETTWNSNGGSGGGGLSSFWPMPSWQAGVVGPDSSGDPCAATPDYCRHVPDVAMNADPNNGYVIYCTEDCNYGGWLKAGGTSAAAPLLAALTADANEYSLRNGGERLGFASPFFYDRFAQLDGLFVDVVDGSNDIALQGKYSAGPDYDLATGLGSLNADRLAQDLAAYTASPLEVHTTSLAASPTANRTITVGQTVTFSGVLTDTTAGAPIAGRVVWLELVDGLGARSWGAVTDASGQWLVSPSGAFRRKATWQAVYAGEAGMAAAESTPHVVYVVPRLALSTALRWVSGHYVVRHGTAFTTRGTTKPNMSGAIVVLQWRPASSSRWRTAGSAQVGPGGSVAVRGSWTVPGRYYMRWRYSGGTGKPWMTASSPAKLFVVR
jgi:pro-kumamolisin-like protein/subtilase family protein